MAKRASARTRRDRWADWIVVAVFAVALCLGWVVMSYAQGQTDTFSEPASGLTLHYPRGWLLRRESKLLFEAVDPTSAGFSTALQVRQWPISLTVPLTASLASTLSDASLARAQEGTGYSLLDVSPGAQINGQPSAESEYVFVAQGSDPFVQQLPVIVRGLDVAVPRGDRAVVFSLLAAEEKYDQAERIFRRFVGTAQWR